MCHHFAFYGDIAANRGYEVNEHVEVDGWKIFPVRTGRIFFKLVGEEIKSIADYVLCKSIVTEDKELASGIIIPGGERLSNECDVVVGCGDINAGERLFVANHAMYEVEIGNVRYQRVLMTDVFGKIVNGEIEPYGDYYIGEDIPEPEKESILDLSLMRKPNRKTKVLSVGRKQMDIKRGEVVYRFKDSGLRYNDKVVLNNDHIHFVIL